MKINEKALTQVQDFFANDLGAYRDMSIRKIVEVYEAAKSTIAEQPTCAGGATVSHSSGEAVAHSDDNAAPCSTQQPDECRKQFIKWCAFFNPQYPIDVGNGGGFISKRTQTAWIAWETAWNMRPTEREVVGQPAAKKDVWIIIDDELKAFALGGEFVRHSIANAVLDALLERFEIRRKA